MENWKGSRLPDGLNRSGTGPAFQRSQASDAEAHAEPIQPRITPLLQHSNTPALHYSITPLLPYSIGYPASAKKLMRSGPRWGIHFGS